LLPWPTERVRISFLLRGVSTINGKNLASDIARDWVAEPKDSGGDFFGVSGATLRDAVGNHFFDFIVGEAVIHVGGDWAWGYGIDADAGLG
jgi:hypothetical protein